eukprot:6560035-Karenia_brevis.AAC.1
MFLAPIRREYAELIKDYPAAIQQIENFAPSNGYGYGTLACTLMQQWNEGDMQGLPRIVHR